MLYFRISTLISVFFTLIISTNSVLGSDHDDVIDIRKTSCRDYLKLDGQESHDVNIFFHGYTSGAANDPIVDIETFRKASIKITDACIDDPKKYLVDVFKQHRE